MLSKRILLPALLTLITIAQSDATNVIQRGVIHFYEPKDWRQPPTNWRDPEVSGAEAIFWWGDIERAEGNYDWSQVDRELAAWKKGCKQLDLRLATAHNSPFIAPQWLFDRYNVRRIGRGHWADFETDLGDGWEDPEVHNDPKEVREKALKMGANILNYIFNN